MSNRYANSISAHTRAQTLMPGGVSSPVRAFNAVGGSPVTAARGEGCRVYDIDDNAYIDYVLSYGPLILGHAPESVLTAVTETAQRGLTFGMTTQLESELADLIIDLVPSIDMVRFVNSGTEAGMSAIRLARAYTGRSKIIKCKGCYHGHADALLVQAGSGATTLGVPSSPGVPQSVTANTLLVEYNDLDAVEAFFKQHPHDIAAMAVEPLPGNMGLIMPAPGYLEGLRKLCDQYGAVLLFDEVMSGFRCHLGGAQAVFGVMPDVTCLGKVVGGGMPCAAYGASKKIMETIAPVGPMYQAGTLSGNPVAMAAGIATLNAIKPSKVWDKLSRATQKLETGMQKAAEAAGVPIQTTRLGSMFGMFFHDAPVKNYAQALTNRADRFAAFFQAMLDNGVMLAPAAYEAWFVSTEHNDAAIDQTIQASHAAFAEAAKL